MKKIIIFSILFFIACSSDNARISLENSLSNQAPISSFPLFTPPDDAKFLAVSNEGKLYTGTSNLELSEIELDDFYTSFIEDLYKLDSGILLKNGNYEFHYVVNDSESEIVFGWEENQDYYYDNPPYGKLVTGIEFIGETSEGKLVFNNGYIYDLISKSGSLLSLNLGGDQFEVKAVSDDFLVIFSGLYYLHDLGTGKTQLLNSCGAPILQAISDTKTYISNCNLSLYNFSSDSFDDENISSGAFQSLKDSNVTYFIGSSLCGTSTYQLCESDSSGTISSVLTSTVIPRISPCPYMNACGSNSYKSDFLFFDQSENFLILDTLTGITVVKKGIDAQTTILSEYNSFRGSSDYENDLLYYLVKDTSNDSYIGIYDLGNDTNSIEKSTLELKKIIPFP